MNSESRMRHPKGPVIAWAVVDIVSGAAAVAIGLYVFALARALTMVPERHSSDEILALALAGIGLVAAAAGVMLVVPPNEGRPRRVAIACICSAAILGIGFVISVNAIAGSRGYEGYSLLVVPMLWLIEAVHLVSIRAEYRSDKN